MRSAADRERERRRMEYLRTGRDPDADDAPRGPVDPADAQARLRELAARRQAQLKALRGQKPSQAEPTEAPAPRPAPGEVVRAELWPGGPVIEVGRAPGRAPVPAAPPVRPVPRAAPKPAPRAPAPRPAESRRAGAQLEPPRAAPSRASARPPAASLRAESRPAAPARTPEQRPARPRPSVAAGTSDDYDIAPTLTAQFDRPTTPEQWRAALIAGEILGRPLALRSPGELPGL